MTRDNIGNGLTGILRPTPAERPSSTNVGLVTTLDKVDFSRIQRAMDTEPEPVMSAGIFPPNPVLIKFATYFTPGTPFSYILQRLHEISSLHPRYHLCDLKDKIAIADIIEPVKGLTTEDRIIFCAAPAQVRSPGFAPIVVRFAECVANSKEVSSNLLDIPTLPLEVLDEEVTTKREYLSQLETLHKALILYNWLYYRFPGAFRTQPMAVYVKGLVEERINKVLAQLSGKRKQKSKNLRLLAMLEEMGGSLDNGGGKDSTPIEPGRPTMGSGLHFDLEGASTTGRDEHEDEPSPPRLERGDDDVFQMPESQRPLGWQQVPPELDHKQNGTAGIESAVGA